MATFEIVRCNHKQTKLWISPQLFLILAAIKKGWIISVGISFEGGGGCLPSCLPAYADFGPSAFPSSALAG